MENNDVEDDDVEDDSSSTEAMKIESFTVTLVGGDKIEATIDNEARTIKIEGVAKGDLITEVEYVVNKKYAYFYPTFDSKIGNWDKVFTTRLSASGDKALYEVSLVDYTLGNTNILKVSLDESNRKQQVLFIGADMERSQNRFADATNQQEIADWCFKDISWNVMRMSYDKAHELNEGVKNWSKYNSALAAMRACRQANPNLEFWGTLKSDYNGYGKECNLPDWICNYGDGSKLLLDPNKGYAETTKGANASNVYLYIDKYAHFLADYFEYFHNQGLTIKYTSTAKEWGAFINGVRTTELIPLLVADLRKRGVPPPMFNDNSEYSVNGGTNTIKGLIANKMAPYYFGFCSHNYPGGEDRTYPFENFVAAAKTANSAANNPSGVSSIYGDVKPAVTYIGTLHPGTSKNGTLGAGSIGKGYDNVPAYDDRYDINNPTSAHSNRYYSPHFKDYIKYLRGEETTTNHFYDASCANNGNWLDGEDLKPLNYGDYRNSSRQGAGDTSFATYDYLLHASKNWIPEAGVTDNTNLNKVFWTFYSEAGLATMGATRGDDSKAGMKNAMLDAVREKCEMYADGINGELIFEVWACGGAGTRAIYFNNSAGRRLSNYYTIHSHANFFNDGMYYYGASQINMASNIYTMQFADFNVKQSDGVTPELALANRKDKAGQYIRRVEDGTESMYICVCNLGYPAVKDFQLTLGDNAKGYNGDVHIHIMDEQTVKKEGTLEGYRIDTKMKNGYLTFDIPAMSCALLKIDLTRDPGSYGGSM